MGELLLTQVFKEYVFEQGIHLYFVENQIRKAKGKVENVVKYVKNNFLHARAYFDLETLQAQAPAWLSGDFSCTTHKLTFFDHQSNVLKTFAIFIGESGKCFSIINA